MFNQPNRMAFCTTRAIDNMSLSLDIERRCWFAATGENEALVDLALLDPATVFHFNSAGQELHPGMCHNRLSHMRWNVDLGRLRALALDGIRTRDPLLTLIEPTTSDGVSKLCAAD